MEQDAAKRLGVSQDGILTIVTLDEHGAYATQAGIDSARNFLIGQDPEMADRMTVVVGGSSANGPAYLAAVLRSAAHAQIVVNRGSHGSFIDPDAHDEILARLLDAPDGATSWSVLDAMLREDEAADGKE